MTKNISILGSTGSVGVQTLDVARNLGIRISGLSANFNIDLLEAQAREFRPSVVAIGNRNLAAELEERLEGLGTEVLYGIEGMKKVASAPEADIVVTSIVGIAGLIPTMEAIRHGKNIALANKETLVTAGNLVIEEAARHKVKLLPVDSEHSAIFQCLEGNQAKDLKRLILTASGGPFRGRKATELSNISVAEALNHPNWKMGSKITIDSATLMNKGLEVIEAKWLFDVEPERISVLVHPQSIIHSMVEYVDGTVIAQLGSTDMRIPIQYALTYPERAENTFPKLDFMKHKALTFEEPDYGTFTCLKLAYEALRAGGTMPAALNAANEVAVSLFLNNEISFSSIPKIIARVMDKHIVNINPVIEDIIETDRWAREAVGGIT